MMEFHISRQARDRYQFGDTLFSLTGNVVFADLPASREFAHRMNQVRQAEAHPERAVHAGALYSMGLIDEATHAVLARYREQFDPNVMTDALAWFSGQVGAENLDKLLLKFVEHFPGVDVYRGIESPAEWLEGAIDGQPNRAAALEELMLLWLSNRNPAFEPFAELFEESDLAQRTAYLKVVDLLPQFFATRPLLVVDLEADGAADVGDAAGAVPKEPAIRRAADDGAGAETTPVALPGKKTLLEGPVTILDVLRAPALAAPGSLTQQLAHIRRIWKPLLGDKLQHGLGVAAAILHEEEVAIWAKFHPPSDADRARGHHEDWTHWSPDSRDPAGGAPPEYEKFSPDVAWMPTAVLLAKSTYVWLAQLSKQYGREIIRLDHIPDEELDTLPRRGMNSLWLIGVWERSRASKTIKQLCGNADAVASAYSLYDYQIAEDLGGERAYIDLRDRCYRRGIRLASDMVANHMGIDSPWVVEHPEWFLSRQDSPYPAYNFDGPDLSSDPRVEIKIERHYYEQTDAAVVFRRVDRQSGETRYIYHGNDGTSFPWNDTAQLDYLNPSVREQVIRTILRVARMFPVIRFDAAMTLAKRHFHRLWFPGPDASGAIPSRAEYSMTDAEFNAVMPNEFWREVVDRVAAEVPGTLLLAEAFWLMEGYFVRTLGMHRVYNSAFMVMLRDEDNANYRTVLKKTLEFDPDIMKRYVNFMSNPDERTTIDQFGDGDKCFGVAALMATLPGLPMFGHGQVEGYTEKYGMEYRRPRYDETASPWLVERHLRQIAPLLHQRWLFAESSNFRLYDFVRDDGVVEEDVFAYSNRAGDKHAVVVYNNRYSSAHGRIDTSAAYADKGSGEQRQQRLRESLGFADEPDVILAYRDSLTGLEYLRRGDEVASRGLRIDLQGYQCHVFLDWRELRATAEKPWDRLCDQLGGRGVPDLESALVNLELQPAHDALRALLQPSLLQRLASLAAPSRVPGTAIEMEDNEEEGLVAPQLAAAVLMHDSKDSIAQFFSQVASLHSVFKDRSLAAYQVLGRASGDFDQALVTETGRLGEDGLGGDGLGQEGVRADPVRDFGVQDDLKALMRLPDLEARLGQPLPPGARGVIPSSSPSVPGAGSWAAAFSWMLIGRLAYSLGREDREAAALDLYERLRLREPLAKAFVEAGLAPDESWRAAARVRVLLLAEAGPARSTNSATPGAGASESLKQGLEAGELVSTPAAVLDAGTKQNSADQATASSRSAKGAGGEVKHAEPSRGILQKSTQDSRNGAKPAPSNEEDKDNSPAAPGVPTTGRVERVAALNLCSPELWQDGDVRWLLGLHEHAGVSYFSKEGFEELAWWLQLPALLDEEAEDPAEKPQHSGYGPLAALERTMRAAEEAGYRLDVFLGAEAARASGGPDKEPAPAVLSAERGSEAGEEEPGPQRKLAQS